MRKVSTALVLLAAGGVAVGCEIFINSSDAKIDGGSGSSGTSTSSSSGDGGGDSGPPDECVPSLAGANAVADTCGVFVRPTGDDTATGEKNKPLQTIGAAVKKGATAIYVCEGTYTENVTITKDVIIYGGVDCDKGWAYDAMKRPLLLSPADTVALTITGAATNVGVEDFAIEANAALAPGGSSIAVVVDSASVHFARVAITANDGMPGDNGVMPADPGYPPSTDPAIKGNDGKPACTGDPATPNSGGSSKFNASCNASLGGKGGDGGEYSGGVVPGYDGQGGLPVEPNKGLGGKGEVSAGWDCSIGGTNGGAGVGGKGADGAPGKGGTGLGTFSQSGYVGTPGAPGEDGKPGQGGGGGGGAKGKSGCSGASGGGGGAGGCGGPGGPGGQAGGASIGIINIDGKLTLNGVSISVGSGGKGGDGALGRNGGVGGFGGLGGMGSGTTNACDGGKGGDGGKGAQGGGGLGGHSVGIAYKGAVAPDVANVMFPMKGVAGAGGLGDSIDPTANNGALGQQGNLLSFQ